MASNLNKYITISFVAVVILALVVLLYINLPLEQDKTPSPQKSEVLLTLTYDDQHIQYALEDLQSMNTYTGYGGYKTRYPSIKGPFEYTGVNITTLLEKINTPLVNYTLQVTARDGWVTNYSLNEIYGNVSIYNASGNQTGVGGVTMLLAFVEDGVYNFSDGPLRIAFVNDNEPYTDSFLWAKYVVSMELIPEE
jgi:hypothetical protein